MTRAQLTHLHHLAQADGISVHLLPDGTGFHPGLGGAFWTLSFSPSHTLVYIPHPRGPGQVISEVSQVKSYTDLFATLQGAALPVEESGTDWSNSPPASAQHRRELSRSSPRNSPWWSTGWRTGNCPPGCTWPLSDAEPPPRCRARARPPTTLLPGPGPDCPRFPCAPAATASPGVNSVGS